MDLLLESLTFRYSAVLFGSVWAWLAVLFAALSLWRIRAVGSSTKPDPQPELPRQPSSSAVGPAEDKLPERAVAFHHVAGGDGGLTKGRYTEYFHVEDNGDGVNEEEVDGRVSDVVDCEEEEEVMLWKSERVGPMGVKMRGDLGWYRYQDLTALDGSVVKLWERDGEFRRRRV